MADRLHTDCQKIFGSQVSEDIAVDVVVGERFVVALKAELA